MNKTPQQRRRRLRLWIAYNRVMDWLAMHLLPAPKPIGLKIYGYDVTRLDIAMVIQAIGIGLVAVWWYGSWGWFLIGILVYVMVGLWMW
jgi:hypothetical protein